MVAFRIKLSLILTYVVFAILLNSVGTVILQSITSYGISKPQASVLEGFKDLSIAGVSFLVASFLPRLGFRNAMMIGLAIVTVAAIGMPTFDSFLMTKLLFLCVGVSFALVKVSVYSTIGLITHDQYSHASFMNILEGMFMVGVLGGYWLFGWFIGAEATGKGSWLDVYWVLAVICMVNIALIFTTPLDESAASAERRSVAGDFAVMLRLFKRPLVYVFVIGAFLYVLIEQGIGTWLPTFNKEVLKLPSDMSVQAASIYAAGLALGRLSAGAVLRRVGWYPVLNVCLGCMAALVILTLPLTHDIAPPLSASWAHAPIAAFIFPLIGLCMAPIYPAINSVILSALPKTHHAAMTGLIVIFSALGGTFGSLMTGLVFDRFGGQTSFYLSLVPITGIVIVLYFFRRETDNHARAGALQQASGGGPT